METREKIETKLKEWKENKQFINVPELFDIAPNIKCFVIVTYKGTGKTTSCIRWIVDNIHKKDFQAAWIRNTDIEFRQSKIEDTFNYWLTLAGKDTIYQAKNGGIYKYKVDKKGKVDRFDKGLLKVLFTTMNKSFNTASQNAIEHCKLIVYDEVINPDFHKPFLVRDFNNLVRTLQRKSNSKICIFGNAHEADNDLISGLGIEFDWESGKTQVIYREEQGLCAIYLERYEIAQLSETDKATDRLFMYSEEVNNFNEGKVANNNIYGIKNKLMIPMFKERYQPLWIYDIKDGDKRVSFAVGKIVALDDIPEEPYLYIEQLSLDKYPDIPRLCYRPQDKNEMNYYVYDMQDMSTVKTLINYYVTGKLRFETTYGRDYFTNSLLVYLKLFLKDENK